MTSTRRIFIVEDDGIIAQDLAESLTGLGYEVVGTARSGDTALEMVQETRPDIVLMDIRLEGDMDGIEAAQRIKSRLDVPIVYLTGYADGAVLERAKLTGPFGYLLKPSTDKELHVAVETAIYRADMERELRLSEERYRAVVEIQSDIICRFRRDTTITFVNPAAVRFFGAEAHELIGRSFLPFMIQEDREEVKSRMADFQADRPLTTYEHRVVGRDGRIRWFHWTGRAVFDGCGGMVEIQAVGRDITERKRAEERVEAALVLATRLRLESEAANVAKSRFLANMSHEIRTPLNSIIGFSELLFDQTTGPLNPKQTLYVKHVLDSGRHLLALINDILDLSKVEAGKMELRRVPVYIKDLLEAGIHMIREKSQRHRLTVRPTVDDELLGSQVPVDEIKLKQILFNLLSNAAKFTADGGTINLRAYKEETDLIISVADTGIGIKKEDHERVFEAFEQVDSSYARHAAGTGLGLALTRRLVQLHGGTIWVESPGPGEGSTFFVRLPLAVHAE
ncbi:MAG: ATP-binding protein [Pseudomonadota bacterium]